MFRRRIAFFRRHFLVSCISIYILLSVSCLKIHSNLYGNISSFFKFFIYQQHSTNIKCVTIHPIMLTTHLHQLQKSFQKWKRKEEKNQHQEKECFKKETCCFVSCFLAAAFSMKRKEKQWVDVRSWKENFEWASNIHYMKRIFSFFYALT